MMRIAAALLGALALHGTSWGTTPPSRTPSSESWRLRPTERLLTTPPMIIHFGWGTSDVSGLIDELSASTAPQLVLADKPGVLEYICSPMSLIPWGASLFRIYELDLLSDLREAEEAAARIGDLPVVVAPRNFPSPTVRSSAVPLPPALVPQLSALPPTPGPKPAPPDPLVKLPRSSATPAPSPEPVAPQRAAPTPESRESLKAASGKLSAAEERIRRMAALVQAAETEVRTAEQTIAPLKEDVAARRRLADAGVIARNDVKAAEERLAEVVAAAEAARSRVAEAQEALRAAEAERDAALAGLERARNASVTEEPPPAAAPKPAARPAPLRPRPRTATAPPALPDVRQDASAPDFPSPVPRGNQLPFDEVPPPEHSFRLAPRPDVPGMEDSGPLPLPDGAGDLTRPRWYEQMAPYQCVVARALLPQGARVTEDRPVLEVRKTSVGRVRAEIDERYVSFCRIGAPVKVVFPQSRSAFVGFISRVEPTHAPRPPGATVEMLLVEGTMNDATVYADLEWLSLATPMLPDRPEPLVYRPPQPERPSPTELPELFPLGPAGKLEPETTEAPHDGRLSGSLQFVSSKRPRRFQESDPVAARKLRRLRQWRRSFIDGMKTTVFPETGLTLTYPREGEVCRAVERMATRRVSHRANMCAKSLAEALGWGLGDAAMWARRLPDRGYKRRKDGIARPGDIVVWPFTYGPSRSQHVGIAVAQGDSMMLLSNEGGVLGTTPLKGGYLAYYRPRPGDAFSGAQSDGKARPTPPEQPPDASHVTPPASEGT